MEEKIIKVLRDYLDCSVPTRLDGTLTTTGEKAIRRLVGILNILELNHGEVHDAIIDLFFGKQK